MTSNPWYDAILKNMSTNPNRFPCAYLDETHQTSLYCVLTNMSTNLSRFPWLYTSGWNPSYDVTLVNMSTNPNRFPCLYTSGVEFHKRTRLIHAPYFEPRTATQNWLTGGKTGTDELGKTPSYAGRRVKPKRLAPPQLSTAARVRHEAVCIAFMYSLTIKRRKLKLKLREADLPACPV